MKSPDCVGIVIILTDTFVLVPETQVVAALLWVGHLASDKQNKFQEKLLFWDIASALA